VKRFSSIPGGISVSLMDPEVALLEGLSPLLASAGVERDDPARERLRPQPYPDDEAASREYNRLIGKERNEGRSADRELFNNGLSAIKDKPLVLSAEEAAAWVRVVGEARIVLSARKGLFEAGMPDEPVNDPEIAFIMFLGLVQEELVVEMLKAMEETK